MNLGLLAHHETAPPLSLCGPHVVASLRTAGRETINHPTTNQSPTNRHSNDEDALAAILADLSCLLNH
jgi:hypothetical protein